MPGTQSLATFPALLIVFLFRLATLAVEIVGLFLAIQLSKKYDKTLGSFYAAVGPTSISS